MTKRKHTASDSGNRKKNQHSTDERTPGRGRGTGKSKKSGKTGGSPWIYGLHAVLAALANPDRRCHRLLVTPQVRAEKGPYLEQLARDKGLQPEVMERENIDHHLHYGSVHQGMALLADPLH
ncbi:MAG: hypothetical protein OEY85_05965, partial [Rhodospirillales bacterium]|nr:hypothetical protein [Rhodospirillales bacterium]